MHPILVNLSVGGAQLSLGSYGVFLTLAALASIGLAGRALIRFGVRPTSALVGLIGAVAAGLVGARLLSVLLAPNPYLANPASVFAFQPTGFALYGGLAGAGIVMLFLVHRWNLSLARLADDLIVPLAAGLVLLRIGCFLNGCCSGLPTSLPWGVTFPAGSTSWGQQVLGGNGAALFGQVSPVHPTQLYEIIAVLVLALITRPLRANGRAVGSWRRSLPAGTAALFFAAGFLAFRAFNQTLRAPAIGLDISSGTLIGIYALAALLFAGALLWRLRAPSLALTPAPSS